MTPEETLDALIPAIALHQDYMNAPSATKIPALQHAMRLYQDVLEVFSETEFPELWAMTQNKLGNAYQNLPLGDRGANLVQAIACYEEALRVRTPMQLPFDSLQTLRNLGHLYFNGHEWQQALESYAQAIMITEQVREAGLTEVTRRRMLEESWTVFERAVLCAVRTDHYSLAFTLTERGKTRNLADHLFRREAKPYGILEGQWQEYQRLLAATRDIERLLSATPGGEVSQDTERARGAPISERHAFDELRALRQSIADFESGFRQADPDYVPFAPQLAMADVVPLAAATDAVLVEFRVTREGTYVFLVGPDDQEVTPAQVVTIPEFTDDVLRRLLVHTENDTPVDGWLVSYYLKRADWLACVERTTRELYENLLVHVHRRLQDCYPKAKRLILVPNKGLNLLPLHSCWWESQPGTRRYILDDYDIAYTPSCQVLKRCLAREQANGAPARNLFAVQNPDCDHPEENRCLHFSEWEVEEVCRFFPESQRFILAASQATAEAVKAHITFGEEKLFSCHGLFDLTHVEQSHLGLCSEGRLSVPDIVGMDLRGTWLAVMSACETGLTDFRDIIDEYQGLPAAFLVAGATTVVPSLWAVNDFSTALLMQRFHRNLYEGHMAKASALCEAQRWLRDLTTEEVEQILTAKRRELLAGGLAQQRMSAVDAMAALFHLKDLGEGPRGRPFANPYWWGAFQCVGAGWQPR